MKLLVALILLLVVIGCRNDQRTVTVGSEADTNQPVQNINPNVPGGQQPERVPGGIGITAGQTGTGTTSGASTGY